jgi:hypothetical protein
MRLAYRGLTNVFALLWLLPMGARHGDHPVELAHK